MGTMHNYFLNPFNAPWYQHNGTFWDVGHGTFFHGQIQKYFPISDRHRFCRSNYRSTVFTYIYDCGASNPANIKSAISEALSEGLVDGEDIDLLIISHFHQDHINGIFDLQRQLKLKKRRIKNILIPFVHPHRIHFLRPCDISVPDDLTPEQAAKVYERLLINPVGTLIEEINPDQIYLSFPAGIVESSNDQVDSVFIVDPPDPRRGNERGENPRDEGPSLQGFVRSVPLSSQQLESLGINGIDSNKVRTIPSGCGITFLNWQILTYTKSYPGFDNLSLQQFLDKHRIEIFSSGNFKKIMKMIGSYHRQNGHSLCIYSGVRDPSGTGNRGIVLSGDSNLGQKEDWKEIFENLDLSDKSIDFLVPHHGSRKGRGPHIYNSNVIDNLLIAPNKSYGKMYTTSIKRHIASTGKSLKTLNKGDSPYRIRFRFF